MKFKLPPLLWAHGAPSIRPLGCLKTNRGWLQSAWCFLVNNFTVNLSYRAVSSKSFIFNQEEKWRWRGVALVPRMLMGGGIFHFSKWLIAISILWRPCVPAPLAQTSDPSFSITPIRDRTGRSLLLAIPIRAFLASARQLLTSRRTVTRARWDRPVGFPRTLDKCLHELWLT